MGLQVAMARIGTALALAVSLPVARMMGDVSGSVLIGAIALCIGFASYLVYCVMDRKEDAAVSAARAEAGEDPEEGFKLSDLKLILCNKGFWLITLLCLMFYAGVFPFLKFATKLMIYKYEVPESFAGLIPALLPFGTILNNPAYSCIRNTIRPHRTRRHFDDYRFGHANHRTCAFRPAYHELLVVCRYRDDCVRHCLLIGTQCPVALCT